MCGIMWNKEKYHAKWRSILTPSIWVIGGKYYEAYIYSRVLKLDACLIITLISSLYKIYCDLHITSSLERANLTRASTFVRNQTSILGGKILVCIKLHVKCLDTNLYDLSHLHSTVKFGKNVSAWGKNQQPIWPIQVVTHQNNLIIEAILRTGYWLVVTN